MACKIHLVPLNAGGSPNGRWFLTDAPVGFDGSLSISCDDVSYTTIGSLPSETIPLDNACTNKHDIWVNIDGEEIGTYIFTFVSPIPNTAEDCAEDCVACTTFVIESAEAAEDQEVSYCSADADVYNVFTLMGISSSDYEIESVTGCTFGDSDCIGFNGNFVPDDMEPGEYVVNFERIGAPEGCDDCNASLTILLGESGDAGDAQNGVVCITV